MMSVLPKIIFSGLLLFPLSVLRLGMSRAVPREGAERGDVRGI